MAYARLKICAVYFANPGAPDEVPAINGHPFTNSQEYPYSFQIGASKQSKFTALVSVSFRWPDGRKAIALGGAGGAKSEMAH